jgi:signal transduction histidine kinase
MATDAGPGIPDEIQSRIFEPFITTKPVGQGTGLGLDVAWHIVTNKHHGDLNVKSGSISLTVFPAVSSVGFGCR